MTDAFPPWRRQPTARPRPQNPNGKTVIAVETESKLPANALQIWKFGHNDAVGASYETIWIVGGTYTWSTWPDWDDSTGQAVTIESDNAADTSIVVAYEGLGPDGALTTGTVTTDASDGTTAVTLDDKLSRLHRAYRDSPDGTSSGNLLFKSSGATVAKITPEIGQTQLGFYTVPAGHTAYLQNINVSVDRNSDAVVQLMQRPSGKAWRSFSGAISVSGYSTINYSANGWKSAPSFAAGTDLECKGKKISGAGSSVVSVNFHLVLVPGS